MDHAGTPARFSLWPWAVASALLHAALLVALLVRPLRERAHAATEPQLWLEALAPALPPQAPLAPEPPPPAPSPPKREASKTPRPRSTAKNVGAGSPRAAASGAAGLPSLESDGTLAIATEGTGATGSADGHGDGDGDGSQPTAAPESPPERQPGARQLSLWLDPQALVRMALVRPSTALLMSVPGYHDALRGSGMRPFTDLQRLRITLLGTTAEGLTVAGVHVAGEPALLDVAKRVAAMRDREPLWRGDANLRATSWIDGTGLDRGIAVHGGTFVIAPRAALPALLGDATPAQRVLGMSQMRERVLVLLTIEDALGYLPGLRNCALQALRLSLAAAGDGYRMALTAHYRSASSARQAGSCLRGLDLGGLQLSRLVDWLAQAENVAGKDSSRLNKEVTRDDIVLLLEELAWALRRA